MTVNYHLCVSTSSPFTLFKLLIRWRGSIWKYIYKELFLWILCYFIISVIYRHALPPDAQQWVSSSKNTAYSRAFANFAAWISDSLDRLRYIPLDFMLGFFVSIVVSRWSVLFSNIGQIDTLALTIAAYLKGTSEKERLWRRNVIRYCVLSQVLVLRDISLQVRNRFPTLDTVVASGLMMPHEKEKFDDADCEYGKSWMPFQWAMSLLRKARENNAIPADAYLNNCMDQVRNFRANIATLTNYDWVPIPIMYPQIVFLAVYTYFTFALIGRQVPIGSEDKVPWFGRYFPLLPALQFLFYMGWVKVAMALLNPMGEDDDDFETNFLIDRNLSIGLSIVDECFDDPPEEKKDKFWSEPVCPLYSEKSAARPVNPLVGSAAGEELPESVDTVQMVSREGDCGKEQNVCARVSIRRDKIDAHGLSPRLKHRRSQKNDGEIDV